MTPLAIFAYNASWPLLIVGVIASVVFAFSAITAWERDNYAHVRVLSKLFLVSLIIAIMAWSVPSPTYDVRVEYRDREVQINHGFIDLYEACRNTTQIDNEVSVCTEIAERQFRIIQSTAPQPRAAPTQPQRDANVTNTTNAAN